MPYNSYPFEYQPLNYEIDALEPSIDAPTVFFHYGKHLKTYVDNLNKALEPYPDFYSWSLLDLILHFDRLPIAIQRKVKNNAGGVYNHNLYFEIITPGGSDNPIHNLKNAINKKFGSYENLKIELRQSAIDTCGSGYACLVSDGIGNIGIKSVPNQETTLLEKLYPIVLIDVWEHAYYLRYQNRRYEYVDKFFNLINWSIAEIKYNTILN